MRILLLDCAESLGKRLQNQGFDVESGTVGLSTGIRKLPSQIYEKDILIYNPTSTTLLQNGQLQTGSVKDTTPEYSLEPFAGHLKAGATVLVFVNRIASILPVQKEMYGCIPYMPPMDFTSDKLVQTNPFDAYPDSRWNLLAPIITSHELAIPVQYKIYPPEPREYPCDVFPLFWNANCDCLGVLILKGSGRLIILPSYKSNDDIIETFLLRVAPQIHGARPTAGLVDKFTSPEEHTHQEELKKLEAASTEIKSRQIKARISLETARRQKSNIIQGDNTAKQVLVYYSEARRQSAVALLYKIIESIENSLGGEARAIAAIGCRDQWKSVKKLANESYRDVRHAPKPTDVVHQWSEAEIKSCFEDTEKIIMAYFGTLF